VTLGSGYADLGGVAIIALYSAGRYATEDRWAYVGVAAAIAVVGVDGLTAPAPWGEAVFGGVVMFVAWYVGRRLRLRGERAAQLLREQAAEARRIVTEERTRIARELHDVVAHRVSLMTVQAGAAKAVAAEDPEGALRAMGSESASGRHLDDSDRQIRRSGHGIVGMRERARLLGGTLDARPRPGGGFRVVAHLPTGGEPA